MPFEQQKKQLFSEFLSRDIDSTVASIYSEFRPELEKRMRKMRNSSIVDYDVQSFSDYYQDAFMRLIRKIDIGDKFESKEKVFGFIARTIHFRYFPRKGLKYQAEIISYEDYYGIVEEPEIQNEKLETIINAFSPRCRNLYRLLFDGHSQKEIAATLGCSYEALRNRKFECLKAVKEKLRTSESLK